MKASELRIGNLVQKYDGNIVKVSVEFLEYLEKYGREKLMTNPPKSPFKPIPLTEKWLLKFGWKNEIRKLKENEKVHLVDIMEMQKNIVENTIELRLPSSIFYHRFDTCIVNYIHQLQNLHFALTETELKTKQ